MSEPARNTASHETARLSTPSGPLRDWLAAMRATVPEAKSAEPEAVEGSAATPAASEKANGWAPRLVVSAPQDEQRDDEAAEIADVVAENMMLKARLRLEADRRDELQLLLAQEIRELRAHITAEIEKFEDLRGERDLWKARCEALMQPLFHNPGR